MIKEFWNIRTPKLTGTCLAESIQKQKSYLTKRLVYNFSEYYEAHFEKKLL